MLPFLYDPKRNQKEEKFVQEELRIELYIPEKDPSKEDKEKNDDTKNGVEIIQLW